MSAPGSVRWIGVLVLAALIACTGARAAPRTPGGYDVSPHPEVLLEDPRAFRRALAARTMPLAEVAESLAVLRELARQLTPERSRTLVAEHVGPAARRGPITRALASAIVFQRWAVVRIAPVAREIEAVVTAVLPAA